MWHCGSKKLGNPDYEEKTVADNDYPNSGILFVNDRQRGGTKDPDRTGNGEIECPHCRKRISFFVNAWLKVGRSGAKFLSLSFKPKDPGASRTAASADGDIL